MATNLKASLDFAAARRGSARLVGAQVIHPAASRVTSPDVAVRGPDNQGHNRTGKCGYEKGPEAHVMYLFGFDHMREGTLEQNCQAPFCSLILARGSCQGLPLHGPNKHEFILRVDEIRFTPVHG